MLRVRMRHARKLHAPKFLNCSAVQHMLISWLTVPNAHQSHHCWLSLCSDVNRGTWGPAWKARKSRYVSHNLFVYVQVANCLHTWRANTPPCNVKALCMCVETTVPQNTLLSQGRPTCAQKSRGPALNTQEHDLLFSMQNWGTGWIPQQNEWLVVCHDNNEWRTTPLHGASGTQSRRMWYLLYNHAFNTQVLRVKMAAMVWMARMESQVRLGICANFFRFAVQIVCVCIYIYNIYIYI